MNYRELLYDAEFIQVKGAVSAGTTDTQTFTEVDMLGYDSVMFLVLLGTVTATAVGTLSAKNSSTSASYGSGTVDSLSTDGTAANVVTATCTTGDSNKMMVLDIHRPPKRYVQGQLARATANIVILGVVAIRYNARQKPTSLGSTNVPSTGTAAISNGQVSAT